MNGLTVASLGVGATVGIVVGIVLGVAATGAPLGPGRRRRKALGGLAPVPVPVSVPVPDLPTEASSTAVDRTAGSVRLTEPAIVDSPFGRRTLGEYLRRYPTRDDALPWVVSEFYLRCASDVQLAPYFAGRDLDALQKHFMAALFLVAKDGLTAGTVQAMRERHSSVRTARGEPISFQIYDLTVAILGQVLAEQLRRDGIDPAPVLRHLLLSIAPLRDAIAVA